MTRVNLYIAALLSCLLRVSTGCQSTTTSRSILDDMPGHQSILVEPVRLQSDLPNAPKNLAQALALAHRRAAQFWPFTKNLKDKANFEVVLLASDENYRKVCSRRKISSTLPCFVESQDNVIVCSKACPANWLGLPPESAGVNTSPLAFYEAVAQQRLAKHLDQSSAVTNLERGLGQWFSLRLGIENKVAGARQAFRDELASEVLTIWLGAPKGRLEQALEVAEGLPARTHKRQSKRRRSQPVRPLALAIFFCESFKKLPPNLLQRCLKSKTCQDRDALRQELKRLDADYERDIRDRLVGFLLEDLRVIEAVIERNVSQSLLALILGQDLDLANHSLIERKNRLSKLKQQLSESAPTVRLLDDYVPQLRAIAASRNQGKAFQSFLKRLKKTVNKQPGYFLDAFERALANMDQAVERRIKSLGQKR